MTDRKTALKAVLVQDSDRCLDWLHYGTVLQDRSTLLEDLAEILCDKREPLTIRVNAAELFQAVAPDVDLPKESAASLHERLRIVQLDDTESVAVRSSARAACAGLH